jgi:hypothetical protein
MYGSGPGVNAGQAIFTDDVSLQVFMEHLKRLVSGLRFCCFRGLSADDAFRLLAPRRIEFVSSIYR